jgi:hypothetical protein
MDNAHHCYSSVQLHTIMINHLWHSKNATYFVVWIGVPCNPLQSYIFEWHMISDTWQTITEIQCMWRCVDNRMLHIKVQRMKRFGKVKTETVPLDCVCTSDPDWNFPSSPEVPFVHTTFFILCLKQRRWMINASISFFKSLFSSWLRPGPMNVASFDNGSVVYSFK